MAPPPLGSSACLDTRLDHRVMNDGAAEESAKVFLSLCHVTQLLAHTHAHSPLFPCSPSVFIPSPPPEGRLSGGSRIRLVCSGGQNESSSSGASGNRKYIQNSAAATLLSVPADTESCWFKSTAESIPPPSQPAAPPSPH